ncbi:MAG: arsenosugar biosynthesis radical SAM (seleno)protein ArsS [Cyanobacteriota bacterium]
MTADTSLTRTTGRPAAVPAAEQRRRLEQALADGASWQQSVAASGQALPVRGTLRVLQLNLGRLCNMACSHCHVDAGPHQGHTQMPQAVVEQCLAAIQRLRPAVVDLTGGAPELHPAFRTLVRQARDNGCEVIDRCNLTVLELPALADLAAFLAEQEVEIVASLPSSEAEATDEQRGEGTWELSIRALQRLNALGYGQGDPKRRLTLMSNPQGTELQTLTPCDTIRWQRTLEQQAGVRFDRLIGLNNMPIARFQNDLQERGELTPYLERLQQAFNPCALKGLMCRDTLSVAADGRLFDCDFNQMLDLPLAASAPSAPRTIAEVVDAADLQDLPITWGPHCFGCAAGQGSSCAGATA